MYALINTITHHVLPALPDHVLPALLGHVLPALLGHVQSTQIRTTLGSAMLSFVTFYIGVLL